MEKKQIIINQANNVHDGPEVHVEISDKIALVILNSPPVNSLTTALLKNLGDAVDELNQNPGVKSIVITGTGRVFASGADIREMSGCKTDEEAKNMSSFGQMVFMKIEQSHKPVIAAINGICLGGGLELAMSCHIRICSDSIIMGMPEISIGMIPAFGGSYRLPLIVGKAKAIEMILTGCRISAEEALKSGLVNLIVPKNDLINEVKKFAGRLNVKSSFTMKLALKSITGCSGSDIDDAMEIESSYVGELYNGHDLKEGVFAFLEKRKPDFLDR
jgi:enoyl-CoA hydratase